MKRIILPLLIGILIAAPASSWGQPAPGDREEAARAEQRRLVATDRAQAARRDAQAQLERAQKAAVAAEAVKQQLDRQYTRLRREQPRAAKKEMLPYCGVSTVEVTPPLASQLKLPAGMGLLVDFVEPGSPAEMAGIKQYDILVKFNDQLLANSEQLRVLVRSKMQSDDVKFAIIRQAKPTSVNVELGQKEMEVEPEADAGPGMGTFNTILPGPGGLEFFKTDVAPGGGAMTMSRAGNLMVWKDAQNTLNVQLKDGKPINLIASDLAGNQIYKGPVATEDQRKALPPELARKLNQVEMGNPMRVAYRAAGPRVLTSTDKDTLMLARVEKDKAVHAFAFSTADGKTLFDGPTATPEERKAMPAEILRQLEALEKNQNAAAEFGAMNQNGF
jgi:membrane-associated protease RseP (regulator of RpoE activity)